MIAPIFRSPSLSIVLCLTRPQIFSLGLPLDAGKVLGDDLEWAAAEACVDLVVLDAEPPEIVSGSLNFRAHDGRLAPARLLEEIRSRAEARKADLLVIFGLARPLIESIRALQALVRKDPLTGLAVPRLGLARGSEVWTLAERPAADRLQMHRRVLLDLPPSQIHSETFEPVTLVRADALAGIVAPSCYENFGTCLRAWFSELRRAGFSTVLDNRRIVPVLGPPETCGGLPMGDDIERLARNADTNAVVKRLERDEALRFERLAAAIRGDECAGPRLLLDARNMEPGFNGTAVSILGVLRGLNHRGLDDNVVVLVLPQSRTFHELDKIFPNVTFLIEVGSQRYDTVLRLSQVWDMELWREIHGWGRAIGCALLDSIGIDTVYLSEESHIRAFQFAGEHTDGLLFNSAYTCDLFSRRFPMRADMPRSVYHHSFDLSEYQREVEKKPPPQRNTIFVVGNNLRHKDVASTVDVLANAFPFQRVTCLAQLPFELGNVEAHASGKLSHDQIAYMYAEAKVVVYPSFYEGFGLPILEGLAAGATVVARASPLLEEIAGEISPGKARLAKFSTVDELVTMVYRLLNNEDIIEVTLGQSLMLNARPLDWAGVAGRVVEFGQRLAREADGARWRARERIFRQMAHSR